MTASESTWGENGRGCVEGDGGALYGDERRESLLLGRDLAIKRTRLPIT